MSEIFRTALIPYTSEQMFTLVNDVKAYPEFIPACINSRVIAFDGKVMQASIELAKGVIRKSFITRNILEPNQSIAMELIEGPFKYLEGKWLFDDLNGQACKISLQLRFEPSGSLLKMAFGAMFTQVANTMVDSFCQRAAKLYAPSASSGL